MAQEGYPPDLRWHPKSLFDSVMRRAVFALSSGQPYEEVAKEARTRYVDKASSPGLDVEHIDVYKLAMDYCSIISNVLYAISCLSLPVLSQPHDVLLSTLSDGKVDNAVPWKFLSNADDSGMLHRWIFVDRWDDDRFTSELHSWYTFGDMAAAPAPMQLHVVEIGTRRSGRMTCAWSRAHKHPIIAGRFKFEGLQGKEWKPMYFADHRITSEEWVTQMRREGLTQSLIHHVNIAEPQERHVQEFKQQVLAEHAAMQQTPQDAMHLAMSREACDRPRACPFRNACYRYIKF